MSKTIRIIRAPGHSPGSVSIYIDPNACLDSVRILKTLPVAR